jgi:acetyl esterase/lipase
MQQFVDTPIWNRPTAEICWQHYLQPSYNHGADDVPAYAAPARALDLSGLPPAYVSTMEFDPLRDEGIHYALRLLQAGVSVELHNYPGTFHGSGMAVDAAVSQREGKEMMAALTRWLHIN